MESEILEGHRIWIPLTWELHEEINIDLKRFFYNIKAILLVKMSNTYINLSII